MSDLSICRKCSNIPCRNGERISPDSFFLVSCQFLIKFGFENGKVFIQECNGFNKRDYLYWPKESLNKEMR